MINHELIENAGLTPGEGKVYLALLKLGQTTTGPIVEKSGVANSIVYKILDSLIGKGLASFIIKEKTKYFTAADPKKIIEYIDERKEKLEENKNKIETLLPQLIALTKPSEDFNVTVFEGFKGFITAWETMYSKLKKGDEYHSWGVYPMQEERFDLYWQRDHLRRKKVGFKGKILFNQGTDKKTLKNRNKYWGCEARYMPSDIKTSAWFVVYGDVTNISLQTRKFEENGNTIEKPLSIIITSKEIAETFESYFQDLWKRSKSFKG